MAVPKGFHHSEATRLQMSKSHTGKRHSAETLERMSIAQKGLQAGVRHPLYGKHLPESTKKKMSEALRGDRGGNWKGGTTRVRGYVLIMDWGHPGADLNGYVREHRLVAERALGRHLKTTEQVHHINGVRSDNRPSNLVICQDSSYHHFLHDRCRAVNALKGSK